MSALNFGMGGMNSPFSYQARSFGTVAPPQVQAPSIGRSAASRVVEEETPTEDALPEGWLDKFGGVEGLSAIAKGIGSIGQIYGAIQGVKLAKDQLAFTKSSYNTNLANTTKSYNTSLEDRTRARYATEGRGESAVNEYLAKHSM